MECAAAKWVYSFFFVFSTLDQCVLLNARGKVDGARKRPNDHHRHVFMMSKRNALDIEVLKANSVRDQLRRHEPFQFISASQQQHPAQFLLLWSIR